MMKIVMCVKTSEISFVVKIVSLFKELNEWFGMLPVKRWYFMLELLKWKISYNRIYVQVKTYV